MLEIGTYNLLTASRKTDNGIYLVDDAGQEVLLPNAYVSADLQLQDKLEVFVYTDSEDRLVATTIHPSITLHEFALLKAQEVNNFGAFMDWGLPKDLLVPFSEQSHKINPGEWHVIYLYLDERTSRLVGSTKVSHFLDNSDASYNPGDEVDLLVFDHSELGYKTIINNKHEGLLFSNEVFQKLAVGHQIKGYIKKVRDDQKIDVSLHRFGYRNIAPNTDLILIYLKNNKGHLDLTDNSKPEAIVSRFGMSKKTFKKAIGDLYKKRLIRIESDGIYLL